MRGANEGGYLEKNKKSELVRGSFPIRFLCWEFLGWWGVKRKTFSFNYFIPISASLI
jgi:hypothetical protein